MFRSLYTAASGMMAQQMNLDNVANNLANSSTSGFRRRRLQNIIMPGAAATQQCSFRLAGGLGTRTAAPK
jgi:flagellar basal-body rod protein FlgG